MKAIDEINRLVKLGGEGDVIGPEQGISYFGDDSTASKRQRRRQMMEAESDHMSDARYYREAIRKKNQQEFIRLGQMRNMTANRQIPAYAPRYSFGRGAQLVQSMNAPTSTVAQSQPYKAWQDEEWLTEQARIQGVDPQKTTAGRLLAGKQSQKMQNGIRRLTPEMAYKAILQKKPNMNHDQARRLASIVSKNYYVDANGNYTAIGGDARRTNSIVARNYKKNNNGWATAFNSPAKTNAVAGATNASAQMNKST